MSATTTCFPGLISRSEPLTVPVTPAMLGDLLDFLHDERYERQSIRGILAWITEHGWLNRQCEFIDPADVIRANDALWLGVQTFAD